MSSAAFSFSFKPPSSISAGLSSPYALSRRTTQSYSSPALWRSATRARCRSRCSREAVRRKWHPAGRPESSSRWWWGGWGPACRARRCPCPSLTPGWQRGGPHQKRTGWRRMKATLGRHNLVRNKGNQWLKKQVKELLEFVVQVTYYFYCHMY